MFVREAQIGPVYTSDFRIPGCGFFIVRRFVGSGAPGKWWGLPKASFRRGFSQWRAPETAATERHV